MKIFSFRTCSVFLIACLSWVPKGNCDEPGKAEGQRPVKLWNSLHLRGLESGFSDEQNFVMSLMYDPLLSDTDKVPIGVFIETLKYQIGRAKDEGARSLPKKFCAFEGLIWVLVDQFGYSARALVGRDQSLLGFSFRVWNNSRTHPLTFTQHENQPLFLANSYFDDDETSNRPKDAAGKEVDLGKEFEWTLKPRESKVVFVSIHSLLPKGFRPDAANNIYFSVYPTMHRKHVPRSMEPQFPGLSGFAARISAEGVAMDSEKAIKEAEGNTPDPTKEK